MFPALTTTFLLAAHALTIPPTGQQLPTGKQPAPTAREDEDDDDDRHAPVTEVTVTARRLDEARTRIEPALGASVYTLSNDVIEARPGGETGDLRSVLIEAPGVAIDASGGLIVRGTAAPVQYRLNNIILPDDAGELGEALSARLAAGTELITGALPAQYGLTSGAVVNVTTKNGHYLAGGQAELYGGSGGTLEPAAEWSHVAGPSSVFLSGSLRSARHSPRPIRRDRVSHDATSELEGFGFVDHVIDANSRMSLIGGSVNERQEIPSIMPSPTASETASGTLTTHNHYLIAAYQRSNGPISLQASVTGLLGRAQLAPDLAAGSTASSNSYQRSDRRAGVTGQFEGAFVASSAHTIRAGVTVAHQHLSRQERSQRALAVRTTNGTTTRDVWSGFVQDEWLVAAGLVANVGVRGDRIGNVTPNFAAQPRAGLIWTRPGGMTLHIGYARLVQPVPLDDVDAARTRESRSDLIDLGVQQATGGLTLGIDGYARFDRDAIGLRYRTDAPLADAFSYARARALGAELAITYSKGPFSAWSNIALEHATGSGVRAGEAALTPVQLSYGATHRIALDTDQRLTASAGASLRLGELRVAGDLAAGSGTPRTALGGAPNGARNSAYVIANAAVVLRVDLIEQLPTDLRLDVRNLLDRRVLLNDGSGLRAGAPAWSGPRGLFVGLEQAF